MRLPLLAGRVQSGYGDTGQRSATQPRHGRARHSGDRGSRAGGAGDGLRQLVQDDDRGVYAAEDAVTEDTLTAEEAAVHASPERG